MPTSGNLASWLLDSALASGTGPRVALREGERAWTYNELADRVARMSAALRTLRLQRGERVLVLMSDTLEAATAILGTIHAGAIAVPVSELATPDDVQEYVLHCGANIAITDDRHEAVLDAVATRRPICATSCASARSCRRATTSTRSSRPRPRNRPRRAVRPTSPFFSTPPAPAPASSAPCRIRQRTIEAARESFAKELLQLTSADRVFSVARLSTAYGLGAGLMLPISVQAESLLFPAQAKSEPLFEALAQYKPTVLFATPSIYAQLAHDAEATQIAKPLAKLRCAIAGAEGMPERLIPRIRGVLGTEVIVGYGLTEIFQFALAGRSDDPGARAGVSGKPLAGVQVRLVDEDGDPVGADEIGTLELQCGSLFTGYWAGQGATDRRRAPRRRLVPDPRSLHDRQGRPLRPLRAGRRPVQGRRQVGLSERGRERADRARGCVGVRGDRRRR